MNKVQLGNKNRSLKGIYKEIERKQLKVIYKEIERKQLKGA
jgi:hypothetical protein